jgi:hypothetical protein
MIKIIRKEDYYIGDEVSDKLINISSSNTDSNWFKGNVSLSEDGGYYYLEIKIDVNKSYVYSYTTNEDESDDQYFPINCFYFLSDNYKEVIKLIELVYGIEKETDDIISRKINNFDFINFSESYAEIRIKNSFITSLLLKFIDRNLSKSMTTLLSKFTFTWDFNSNENGRGFIQRLTDTLFRYYAKCVKGKIKLEDYNTNCVHSLVEKVSNITGNDVHCVQLIAYTSMYGDIWSLNKMKKFVKFGTDYTIGYIRLGPTLSSHLISDICYLIDKSNDSLNSQRIVVGTEIYRLSEKKWDDNMWFSRLVGKAPKSAAKDLSSNTKRGFKFIKDFNLFK